MVIKHLAKCVALTMTFGLWSCSNDDLPGTAPNVQEEGDFYATVTLNLPTAGSRSETDDPVNNPAASDAGFEVGRNSENTVTSVLVVLAAKDGDKYNWISSANTVAENIPPESGTNHMNQYLLRFRSNELIEAAQNGLITGPSTPSGSEETTPGKPLYVFVYCNPPSSFKTTMSSEYFSPFTATNVRTDIPEPASTDLSIEIPQLTPAQQLAATPIRNSISQPNQFLMTNAALSSYTFEDENIVETLRSHNKPANALNIGEVEVERASCRFDYKPSGAYEVKYNDDLYASIEIDGMALFNESKNFYMFPRVTLKPTDPSSSWKLCGKETPSNWVVSPNWPSMKDYAGSTSVSKLFNYATTNFVDQNIGALPRSFTYTYISEKSLDDNHEATSPNEPWSNPGENEGYKIWRYTTENTIPGIDQQKNGISTGIYFRAKLNPLADPAEGSLADNIKKAMAAGEPIFAYSDNLADGQNNTADVHTLLGSAQDLFNYVAATSTSQQSEIAKGFLQGFKYGFFIITPNGATDPLSKNLDINNSENLEKIFTTTNKVTIPTNFKNQTNTKVITTITLTDEDSDGTNNTTKNIYLKDLGFYAYYATVENSKNIYYVYYPYYNRHNDNHDNYDMGPMEFATVRNNIYKLQVTNITRIGLPGDVPPDPDTPDESEDVYIQVKVKVLDWVVRLNNIEF